MTVLSFGSTEIWIWIFRAVASFVTTSFTIANVVRESDLNSALPF